MIRLATVRVVRQNSIRSVFVFHTLSYICDSRRLAVVVYLVYIIFLGEELIQDER